MIERKLSQAINHVHENIVKMSSELQGVVWFKNQQKCSEILNFEFPKKLNIIYFFVVDTIQNF